MDPAGRRLRSAPARSSALSSWRQLQGKGKRPDWLAAVEASHETADRSGDRELVIDAAGLDLLVPYPAVAELLFECQRHGAVETPAPTPSGNVGLGDVNGGGHRHGASLPQRLAVHSRARYAICCCSSRNDTG